VQLVLGGGIRLGTESHLDRLLILRQRVLEPLALQFVGVLHPQTARKPEPISLQRLLPVQCVLDPDRLWCAPCHLELQVSFNAVLMDQFPIGTQIDRCLLVSARMQHARPIRGLGSLLQHQQKLSQAALSCAVRAEKHGQRRQS
jgi:hypothetical protein